MSDPTTTDEATSPTTVLSSELGVFAVIYKSLVRLILVGLMQVRY